jgi:serine/threonine protein phosphatase PrpC
MQLHVFLSALVRELQLMHREQSVHGNVKNIITEWLDETTGEFHPEKFREAADKTIFFSDAAMKSDVAAFVDCAKHWILLSSGSTYTAFKAENHAKCQIPLAFLKLLENCAKPEDIRIPNMSIFAELLECASDVPTNTPNDHNAANIPAPKSIVTTPPFDGKPNLRISLRNGTVGKPYEIEAGAIAAKIAASRGDLSDAARISHLQLPIDSGLVFNESTGSVSGIPTRAFEETLLLDYAASPATASIRFEATLLINPDPASLWKDLDPPAESPYQKDSLVHSSFHYRDFRVIAASRRGRSHANKGNFRDDDFAVGFSDHTGWLVVAVADGAGSAKYSRKGSSIACTVARDWLVATLSAPEYQNFGTQPTEMTREASIPVRPLRDLLYDAARLAHDKIDKEAQNPSESLPEPPTIRNYDTTLIILLMKKMGDKFVAATFSIGDGGAGILPDSELAVPLTTPDGGEHAGQTTFLTIPSSLSVKPENLEKRYHQEIFPNFVAALAMTDGITDPKFPSDAAYADPACWQTLWKELEPVTKDSESLLEWMNFFSPGNHDDRTLVAVLPSNNKEPE